MSVEPISHRLFDLVLFLFGQSVEFLLLLGLKRTDRGSKDGHAVGRGRPGSGSTDGFRPVCWWGRNVVEEGGSWTPGSSVGGPDGAAEIGSDVDGVGSVAVGLRRTGRTFGVAFKREGRTTGALSDGGHYDWGLGEDRSRGNRDRGRGGEDRRGDELTTFCRGCFGLGSFRGFFLRGFRGF